MPAIRSLFSLFVAFVLIPSLPAQQLQTVSPPILRSDPHSLQLAAQSLAAMKYVAGPLSIRATGTIHSPDQEDGTFEVIAQGPRIYRTITTRDSGTYVYVMNDGIGSVTLNGKTRHVGGATVMGMRCPFFPLYSFIGETNRPDVTVEPLRSSFIAENATYILRTVTKDLTNPTKPLTSVSELEVDAKSSLPLKLRTQLVHSQNIEIVANLEYSFSEYRQEGTLLLPHTIAVTIDGVLNYTVTLTSFQFDVPTDLTVTLQ